MRHKTLNQVLYLRTILPRENPNQILLREKPNQILLRENLIIEIIGIWIYRCNKVDNFTLIESIFFSFTITGVELDNFITVIRTCTQLH